MDGGKTDWLLKNYEYEQDFEKLCSRWTKREKLPDWEQIRRRTFDVLQGVNIPYDGSDDLRSAHELVVDLCDDFETITGKKADADVILNLISPFADVIVKIYRAVSCLELIDDYGRIIRRAA